MTITAKFPSVCPSCHGRIQAGQQIEWAKGEKARHTDCTSSASSVVASVSAIPAVTLETVGTRVYVRGNSYPIKGAIKSVGGHWDGDEKAWWVGATKRDDLEAAIASAKPEERGAYRPSRCKQCGARPGPRGWPRIYRNGICSDCYRDDCDDDY